MVTIGAPRAALRVSGLVGAMYCAHVALAASQNAADVRVVVDGRGSYDVARVADGRLLGVPCVAAAPDTTVALEVTGDLTLRRPRPPRTLDWLFAHDGVTPRVYYFEVARRIATVEKPAELAVDDDVPGTIRVSLSGFARVDGPRVTPLGTRGDLRWEEDRVARVSRPDLRPLGIFSMGDRVVWVHEGRTPLGTTLDFYTVGSGGVEQLASTRLGRC